MRIISKEHDYYDCIMKQFCDRSIVFARSCSERMPSPFIQMGRLSPYEIRAKMNYWANGSKKNDQYYYMGAGFLFFCGTIYPFVEISEKFYYDVASLPPDTRESAIAYSSIWINDGKVYSGLAWCKDKSDIKQHLKWCKAPRFVLDKVALTQYALKNGVAYFVLRSDWNGDYLVHYPVLKDLKFNRVVFPQDAFQRIQMYLTNELAREKQMPENPISDKLKAESHGFDKWSFRKEPSNEKRKR